MNYCWIRDRFQVTCNDCFTKMNGQNNRRNYSRFYKRQPEFKQGAFSSSTSKYQQQQQKKKTQANQIDANVYHESVNLIRN